VRFSTTFGSLDRGWNRIVRRHDSVTPNHLA
jgi:hypothetical protein